MNSICVLGNAGLGPDAAGAVSLTARRTGPVAVVLLSAASSDGPSGCDLPGPRESAQRVSLPPTLGAARLGGAIRQQGHPARASWRLVTSRVDTVDEAVSVGGFLASQGVRPVFGVEGPSDIRVKDLLAEVDACLIAVREGTPESFGVSAGRLLITEGVRMGVMSLPEVGLGTALVAAGIAAPGAWVSPIEACLPGLLGP
ncbi:MAG: hypothetical protein F2799_00855 [Actinobacteria bacterium]|uniref:Unannotated protein n=1 Tax=freshwater metagenome TaxID=449393 RepID=A0A6J7CT56_9ZZZZ|nr:hypothetical protein [Actinomycetota bacterium]